MTDLSGDFRRLHEHGLLRLPNAWDAVSARLAEEAGAKAIATTSAAVAWSLGYPDGDALPVDELAAAVARIVRMTRLPVTADIEGGYAEVPAEVGATVMRVLDAGAVGINIEDGRGSPDLLVRKIEAARAAADRVGMPLFINARTDVFLAGLGPEGARLDETLARAALYRQAGADGFFVPYLPVEHAAAVAGACGLPLNLLDKPGLPGADELAALGVRRLSAGSGIAERAWGFVRGEMAAFLGQEADRAPLDYRALNALFA